jgi:diguanylate cyclase (GGDEF)-like protein
MPATSTAQDKLPARRRWRFLLWPALALLLSLGWWSYTVANARRDMAQAEQGANKDAAAYAEAYEQYITRSLAQMDQVTMQLKQSWEQSGAALDLEALRRDGMFTDSAFVAVAIYDRDGKLRSSTRRHFAPAAVRELDFFIHHRDNNSTALQIGVPQDQRGSSQGTVQFTRRLDGADDSFGGVLVLTVQGSYFTSFYSARTLGRDGLVALLGDSGGLRLERHGIAGAGLDDSSLLRARPDLRSREGVRTVDGGAGFRDGQTRILAWHQSPAYPVVALVGLARDEAMAGAWQARETRYRNALVATCMLLLLSAWAAVLARRAQRREHEEEEGRRAHDILTGLPNRYWLASFLPGALAQAKARGTTLALLFIDLDEFKHVNDTQGHAAGDLLLRQAAARLKSLLRPGDQVVRFGGDEFIVLLDPVDSEQQVAAVADRILKAFGRPFDVAEESQSVGASIGISLYPRDGEDPESLIKHGDIAMYSGKSDGKGQYRFFDPALYTRLKSRARLKNRLLEAIECNQLQLYYQPRVDTRTGELRSMEALVRWMHPELGLIPPVEFIPLAESSGMILQIGEIVMDQACAQLAAWQAAGLKPVPVSINVSPKQFAQGNIHRQLAAQLARHRVDPGLLEVEITESAMMGEQDEIIAELAAIRALGVKLHVDDFGTGYSSLSQLQKLKMDVLKVDKAFTSELCNSVEGRVFFQAIVSMAHALGMDVVAEGVETAQQLQVLQGLGCNEVQGYYVARPMPPADIEECMRRRFLFPQPADAVMLTLVR